MGFVGSLEEGELKAMRGSRANKIVAEGARSIAWWENEK